MSWEGESGGFTTLQINDDDDAPKVTLSLSSSPIDESGSSNVATVTATLNRPSSADHDGDRVSGTG